MAHIEAITLIFTDFASAKLALRFCLKFVQFIDKRISRDLVGNLDNLRLKINLEQLLTQALQSVLILQEQP